MNVCTLVWIRVQYAWVWMWVCMKVDIAFMYMYAILYIKPTLQYEQHAKQV